MFSVLLGLILSSKLNYNPVQFMPNMVELASSAYENRPTDTESLVRFWARIYGVDEEEMIAVMKCESGGSETAFNAKDPNGGSRGLFQYQTKTFYGNAKNVVENPDIWDSEQQIIVTAKLFSEGKQHLWSCWKKLYN